MVGENYPLQPGFFGVDKLHSGKNFIPSCSKVPWNSHVTGYWSKDDSSKSFPHVPAIRQLM